MLFPLLLETCTLVLLGVYGGEVVVFEMDGEMVEVWLKQGSSNEGKRLVGRFDRLFERL